MNIEVHHRVKFPMPTKLLLNLLILFALMFPQLSYSLNHWSADTNQIMNVNCHSGVPSVDKMYDYLITKNKNIKSDLLLKNGSKLKLDVYQLGLFHKLTSIDVHSGKPMKNELQNISFCDDFKCVLSTIFNFDGASFELGVMYAYVLEKFGLNASQLVNHNSKSFTVDEFKSLIFGLEAIPENLFPIFNNKRLARYFNPNVDRGESRNLANSSLEFFDHWSSFNFYERAYTIYHEVAHNLGAPLSIMYSDEWYNVAGWANLNGNFYIVKETQTSLYAKEFPNEDFAESVSAYRFNPEILYKKSIEKYNFIKWVVYRGVEFRNEVNCNISTFNHILQKSVDEMTFIYTNDNKDNIVKKCGPSILNSFLTHSMNGDARKCINNELMREALKEKYSSDSTALFLINNDESLINSLVTMSNVDKTIFSDINDDIKNMIATKKNEILKYVFLPDLKRKKERACVATFNFSAFEMDSIASLYGSPEFSTEFADALISYCKDNVGLLIKSQKRFFESFLNLF